MCFSRDGEYASASDEADVYEEVDEREFESRTAGDRQQAHDFIEDDGASPPPRLDWTER